MKTHYVMNKEYLEINGRTLFFFSNIYHVVSQESKVVVALEFVTTDAE